MNRNEMISVAQELVTPGKGILAADESGPTIEKRFKTIGVASTPENRRDYRELLFSTPGLNAFISGVILYDETLRQQAANGTRLVDLLSARGLMPGIKVDLGTKPLANFPGETITEGLDGLRERLAEYRVLGARFTKWRAVIAIGENTPTLTGAEANAHVLARYAALSQEAGLVPIVEPEVLMDGPHSIQRHHEVTQTMLRRVFHALFEHRVHQEAMLLKANMVLPGSNCSDAVYAAEVAERTMQCIQRTVPSAVPGIVFLSGGQGDVQATHHLNLLNRLDQAPWQLSFSFGRALQAPALRAWAGQRANVPAAQQALLKRARCNSAARFGQYGPEMEASAA